MMGCKLVLNEHGQARWRRRLIGGVLVAAVMTWFIWFGPAQIETTIWMRMVYVWGIRAITGYRFPWEPLECHRRQAMALLQHNEDSIPPGLYRDLMEAIDDI